MCSKEGEKLMLLGGWREEPVPSSWKLRWTCFVQPGGRFEYGGRLPPTSLALIHALLIALIQA